MTKSEFSIDVELVRSNPSLFVQNFLFERRKWFLKEFDSGADSLDICRENSRLMDRAITALFNHISEHAKASAKFAIVGLGGYGREELGLYSDVDLLFLHEDATPQFISTVTDGILYPFWNNNAEVGGSTRSIGDCRQIIETDIKALTAMTDARLVAGDARLFRELEATVSSHFLKQKTMLRFIGEKIREHEDRIKKFGDSIYLMQPNVKEGEGGLRDIHTLLWMAKVSNSEIDRAGISPSFKYLWKVRHAIHLNENKRVDRLEVSKQADIARIMGYKNDDKTSAEEKLMSDFHRHTFLTHKMYEREKDRISKKVFPEGWRRRVLGILPLCKRRLEDVEDSSALEILGLFLKAKNKGHRLDPEMKSRMIKMDLQIDDSIRNDACAAKMWREIFSTPRLLYETILDLHECGLFLKWFPEMEHMFYRVEHDGFHFYPAGIHSLMALRELTRIPTKEYKKIFPLAAKAYKNVSRKHLLFISGLFHDVGKGLLKDHAEVGAQMISVIMTRMGFDGSDVSDAAFLVRSHLLMTRLAFKRDLKDIHLIRMFSESVGSTDILSTLYLLTFADLRAVGPNVWNDWKGGLLNELYEKARAYIAGGEKPVLAFDRARAKKLSIIKQKIGRDCGEGSVAKYLATLPEKYFYSNDPDTIAAHLIMLSNLSCAPVQTVVKHRHDLNITELSIVTRDALGLFAKIAGVLAANSVNILEAELYTTSGGFAVDVFKINDIVGRPMDDEDVWNNVRGDLINVISGASDLEKIVGGRLKRRLLSWSARHRPPKIIIDNDVSANETVVDISADDRRGLLYTIAWAFYDMGITIDTAKITTHVDRVTDVFYIRDINGYKITDKDKVESIRKQLFDALEE